MFKRILVLVPFLFAAAFAFGLVAPVSAAPAADLDNAAIDALLTGEIDTDGTFVEESNEIDHRGRRRGRRGPSECARFALEVKKACPCNGPDGDGWGDDGHSEYVDCVSDKLDEIVDDENEAQLECATKIIERAEASEIGNDGFECPTREGRCGRDKGKRPSPPAPDPGL